MNELFNNISLHHRQAITIDVSDFPSKVPAIHLRGLLMDIAQLGYTLNGNAVRAVRTLTETDFKKFHTMLISNLKQMVGADVQYNALFKNFPDDIPNDDYFTKRVIGYVTNLLGMIPDDIQALSCGHIVDSKLFNVNDFGACPICQHQVDELTDDEIERPPLEDVTPFKILDVVDSDEIYNIFENLLASKSSISENDRITIQQLIESDPSFFTAVPETIHMKEIMAVIGTSAVNYEYNEKTDIGDFSHAAADILIRNFKTATDILRLSVALSGGDISLAEATHFRLKNKERRVIMWLLDEVNAPEEDMLRYKMRWIRLAEVLHIGKFAKKFPNAFSALDRLRNRPETIETFNGKVEKLVETINSDTGSLEISIAEAKLLVLLSTRPGELTRRLDWMLRTFSNPEAVCSSFEGKVKHLPTPMLLTLYFHISSRIWTESDRYFMPKGNIAKIQVITDSRKPIAQKFINVVNTNIHKELIERFSKLESLGNVYINPELKNYLVPLVQRNATKNLVTVARGSQIPLMETKAARMFVYWKQNKGHTVDVDLSAISYSSDWKYKNHISYTHLSEIGGIHSGDIQSAPKGAAEFIDIDLATARKNGVRYIVMNIISFTGQTFDTFKCHAGIMERDKVSSGKKFEATTVANKFDIDGDTRYNIPMIFDLHENKIIWADLALSAKSFSTVEGKSKSIVAMAKAIVSMQLHKPNLFELLHMHSFARAENIDKERIEGKEYDTVFDIDIASKNDEILGKYL